MNDYHCCEVAEMLLMEKYERIDERNYIFVLSTNDTSKITAYLSYSSFTERVKVVPCPGWQPWASSWIKYE